jgi:hypothetical protein
MPVGGSTWAHGPDSDVEESELPQDVQFSVTSMPARQAPPAPPTEQQAKLHRQVPGPTEE